MGLKVAPSSFLLNEQLATEYFFSRRVDEFYAKAKDLMTLQPDDGASHLTLARALEWQGRYDEALLECAKALNYRMVPASVDCFRATIEASRRNLLAAARLASEVEGYWRKNPFETILLVALYSRLGEIDKAFTILEQGYERYDNSILTAMVNPYLDVLRSDPRWLLFLGKLGLKA
jgi:tetratricopeptide (TPR) repeat protein